MKKTARFIAMLLVLLLTVTMFGACGNKENVSSDASSAADLGLSNTDVNFVTDGESTYRIVRPEGHAKITTAVATSVVQALKKTFSVSPRSVFDSEDGEGYAEIIIGTCNRPEVEIAKKALLENSQRRRNEFIICTVSDDIVIIGITDDATIAGVEYFVNNYINGNVITGGINYVYLDTAEYAPFTIFGLEDIQQIKIVRPIYNVSYLTQVETDTLVDTIIQKTGYEVLITHDKTASTDGSATLTTNTPAEYEIIIGACARDGVRTYSDKQKDSYEIRIEDKKIYLNGGSPYATALAVTEFTKLVEKNSSITPDMSVSEGDYQQVVNTYNPASYYYPTWLEDFDGNAIDYNKWNVDWDGKTGYTNPADGRTQYRGSSVHKNNYVQNGKMYQVAVKTSNAYYGGMFYTAGIMEYLYGYLEISTLHPKGLGFWTALWTESEQSSSDNEIPSKDRMYKIEVDVEECYGNGGDWVLGNTFAWPTEIGKNYGISGEVHVSNRKDSKDDRGFFMDFHTFGYEWIDNTHVRFTCDGEVYADQLLTSNAERHAFQQPTFLRLSMACGTASHGEPTTDPYEWENTNKYIVDWVHIYQKSGQKIFKKQNGRWKTYVR